MFYDILTTILLVFSSLFLAELYGYWVHTLLHSDKIRWLSSRHMEHHLVHYAPGKKQRPTTEYISPMEYSGDNKGIYVFGIGLEFVIPSLLLLVFTAIVQYYVFYLSLISILVSSGIMILYALFMFGYLHDSMHIKGHWLYRVPLLKGHFKNIRKLHDIHHHAILSSGLLRYNMGITSHIFDKVFRTYLPNMKTIPKNSILLGHKKAIIRYNIDPNHNSTA
jgi:sterol desaturase/sphingolipid hydroxylase (fatty acid hydroxylase superfamily)